jgi:glutamate-5-semialdehyde dehydrogenase
VSETLTQLTEGQLVPFGGNRAARVDAALAAAFQPGDHLVVVHDTGDLLHITAADHAVADGAVTAAEAAFAALATCGDDQITAFYEAFADLLADDAVFGAVAEANAVDVDSARGRGRSTTRLVLSPAMRSGMIDGLRAWASSALRREEPVDEVRHPQWSVEAWRAPLGVVGFVFEGRPNVFADAAGVLRTGNTAVFRIGSDALGTATAIMARCVDPALVSAGLPVGALQLLASSAHAAGWALFADRRLSLAVARGSGAAVSQLGAVARQHGVPASLHGSGGAWLVVGAGADHGVVFSAVRNSLDRKVCNTLNVCCVVGDGGSQSDDMAQVVRAAADAAAAQRGASAIIHDAGSADDLGHEFEWEDNPEFWLVAAASVDEAVRLFNEHSPRFVASLISSDAAEHERFYRTVDAPFVGNGFTRWVDGQFALNRPELGLSNWQFGRILARSGVLSGDSVHTVRLRATVHDHAVRR